MQGEFFKGNIYDVCAELEREARNNKGMTVGEWLQKRKLERVVNEQIEEIYRDVKREKGGN